MPKKLKYSRQRASIEEYLSHTTEHPTADTVYEHIRREHPNISLGTVYRNLNLLADQGIITKITTPGGGVRFDMQKEFHYHVLCEACGRVDDILLDADMTTAINTAAAGRYDGEIHSHAILYEGICGDCLRKQQNDK